MLFVDVMTLCMLQVLEFFWQNRSIYFSADNLLSADGLLTVADIRPLVSGDLKHDCVVVPSFQYLFAVLMH